MGDPMQFAGNMSSDLLGKEGETMKCKCGNEMFWPGNYCPKCGKKLEPDYVELSFGAKPIIRVTEGPCVFMMETNAIFSGLTNKERLREFCEGVLDMLDEDEKPKEEEPKKWVVRNISARPDPHHTGLIEINEEISGNYVAALTPSQARDFANGLWGMAVEMQGDKP